METDRPVSVHPDSLARLITALANSGGGCFFVEAEHGPGRKVLATALTDILPRPVLSSVGRDKTRDRPLKEKKQLQINSIVCPPHLSVREEENGMIVTVTPGDAFCTLIGEVIVLEGDTIQTLTIADVVRISGSGG